VYSFSPVSMLHSCEINNNNWGNGAWVLELCMGCKPIWRRHCPRRRYWLKSCPGAATENERTRELKTRRGSESDTGKRGTQNEGLENATMFTMESQNALMFARGVCVWVHAVYLSLRVFAFSSVTGIPCKVGSLFSRKFILSFLSLMGLLW